MQPNRAFSSGFVKVELRSRSPKLWSWTMYCEVSDRVLNRSAGTFRYSEDAWKAGQVALASIERSQSSPVEAMCQAA